MSKKKELTASDITGTCIGWRIRFADRVVGRTYDTSLRPLGLRATQLAMLAFAEERGVLRQSEICAEYHIDDSTLSRNLERMEANGWLEATPGEDAREHPYQLTSKGRRLLKQALPLWSEAQAKVSQMLGSDGMKAVSEFVKRQTSQS